MKRFYVYLLLVCLLVFFIVGCFRALPPAQPDTSHQALFTATDVRRAKKVIATTLEKISGSDLNNPVDDRDPAPVTPEAEAI